MNKLTYGFGLIIFTFLLGCSDKKEEQKFAQPIQTENTIAMDKIVKTTKYFNYLKNLPALPVPQQQTINIIIEGYNSFYNEKDYYSSSFKNKYAKEHNMVLRRDGSIDPIEPGAKGRFSYSYATVLQDGSEANVVYQHYNFGENVYAVNIEKMSLFQCQHLRAYVSHQPNLSIQFQKRLYLNGYKGYRDTTCEKEEDDTTVVITSEKMYQGHNYFSNNNNDINRFFNIVQSLLMQDYDIAEKNSYGKNFYLGKRNEIPTHADFLLGIDYFIDEYNKEITVGAVKEDVCKYIVYHLSEAPPSLTISINNEKGCQKGFNIITFKLKKT